MKRFRVLAIAFAFVLGPAMPAGAQAPDATLPSQCNDQMVTPRGLC